MFSALNMCRYNNIMSNCVAVQARYKSKTHWAKLKKKTSPKYKARNHFEEFYGNVFGEKWPSIREGLLSGQKYAAIINNYGNPEETMQYLANRGAHSLENLMKIQKKHQDLYEPQKSTVDIDKVAIEENSKNTENSEEDNIATINNDDTKLVEKIPKFKNLQQSLAEAQIDESRIIDPSISVATDALYQYIPATELKGMDDYVFESSHYNYYPNLKDFPINIEAETEFNFPEHLKVYTYEMGSDYKHFPEPRRSKIGVFNYYPMDCASAIAVLALQLSGGERVLDLCSAPGGKALIALQSFLPDVIVCNDVSISRFNRMHRLFRDYFPDFETSNKWRERVLFKKVDGRVYTDSIGFDKVLVDVPCTTDRLSVNEDDNNIFRPDRIKERLRIPEMQSQLLANALRLVKIGGAVVYSTCSLSPVQNDGVVHMALKQVFENDRIEVDVKDLSQCMAPLSSTLHFATGDIAPKYGQLIIPQPDANFGPMYFARLIRRK